MIAMLILIPLLIPAGGDEVKSIPTFECIGLEWPRADGGDSTACTVEYRASGILEWCKGFPLAWDSVEKQYRGSLVQLKSGTEYEVRLTLSTGATASVRRWTWNDAFPVGSIVTLPKGTLKSPLVIDSGGTAEGFKVVRAHPEGTTIDVEDGEDHAVVIRGDFVILQGVTCKGARIHGILIDDRHDVVIEGCDISQWGRPDPTQDKRKKARLGAQLDSGIWSRGRNVERIVIQGNRIHHPRYTSNYWTEWSPYFNSSHPQGPKAVVFQAPTKGRHVLRYNDISSDNEHLFNDVLFESPGDVKPAPGNGLERDSDIYGNILTHFADDCMELERGSRNVRVFGNYIAHGFKSFSAVWLDGPVYLFRNVTEFKVDPMKTADGFLDSRWRFMGPYFGPLGSNPGRPRLFVFHNTVLADGEYADTRILGSCRDEVSPDLDRQILALNNIFQTRASRRWDKTYCIHKSKAAGPALDYNLCNGAIDDPACGGPHNISGAPRFRSGQGSGLAGRFQLEPGSPGHDAGVAIPGFNEGFHGRAPDIGAHEEGSPDLVFGPRGWIPSVATGKTK
jgi:hypothetical protein